MYEILPYCISGGLNKSRIFNEFICHLVPAWRTCDTFFDQQNFQKFFKLHIDRVTVFDIDFKHHISFNLNGTFPDQNLVNID